MYVCKVKQVPVIAWIIKMPVKVAITRGSHSHKTCRTIRDQDQMESSDQEAI